MFIFAIGLRICEFVSSQTNGSLDFVYYTNTFWFVGVTMTTVGYGDYVPKTLAGRFFSFIICIWGLFFISLGFVSLINLLKLSIPE